MVRFTNINYFNGILYNTEDIIGVFLKHVLKPDSNTEIPVKRRRFVKREQIGTIKSLWGRFG